MYKFTANNLLRSPINYQFSDVSENNFIKDYKKQREKALYHTLVDNEEDCQQYLELYAQVKNTTLLKFQKKFEVKKKFFQEESMNINFLLLLSYQLTLSLDKDFCYSLLSTLLKVNDTLTSLNIDSFTSHDKYLLNLCITRELNYVQSVENA